MYGHNRCCIISNCKGEELSGEELSGANIKESPERGQTGAAKGPQRGCEEDGKRSRESDARIGIKGQAAKWLHLMGRQRWRLGILIIDSDGGSAGG